MIKYKLDFAGVECYLFLGGAAVDNMEATLYFSNQELADQFWHTLEVQFVSDDSIPQDVFISANMRYLRTGSAEIQCSNCILTFTRLD